MTWSRGNLAPFFNLKLKIMTNFNQSSVEKVQMFTSQMAKEIFVFDKVSYNSNRINSVSVPKKNVQLSIRKNSFGR